MARYVVVEFARNGDADIFIESINNETRAGTLTRIAGVFVKPTRWCMCDDWEKINYGDKNQKHGVGLGERFGWWVCTYCQKPRRAGHTLRNQILPSEMFPELLRDKEDGYEYQVTGLGISGFANEQIARPKKLRKVRKLWPAESLFSSLKTAMQQRSSRTEKSG